MRHRCIYGYCHDRMVLGRTKARGSRDSSALYIIKLFLVHTFSNYEQRLQTALQRE